MTNYLVTNIQFTNRKTQQVIERCEAYKEFKLPADINGIQEWLLDYDYKVSNEDAYAAWLRSVLFYNYKVTFEYTETGMTADKSESGLWLADLADFQYDGCITKTVVISVPSLIHVEIDEHDITTIADGVEQAIYEQLLQRLPLTITVI